MTNKIKAHSLETFDSESLKHMVRMCCVRQVHVLASVLKSFFRDMPEPLLTFDCYEDFLRAANLTEDRVSTLFAILKKLPKFNFDLMERLMFHLAR